MAYDSKQRGVGVPLRTSASRTRDTRVMENSRTITRRRRMLWGGGGGASCTPCDRGGDEENTDAHAHLAHARHDARR